jgi:hypothetical protein
MSSKERAAVKISSRVLTITPPIADRTAESLQQQAATADVLKVISSSPGELEPVFEQCLPTLHNPATAGTRIRSKNPQISALRGLIATGEVRIGSK